LYDGFILYRGPLSFSLFPIIRMVPLAYACSDYVLNPNAYVATKVVSSR
jgi:hypothetical protein